jgi:two-component system, sensor histidine kinase and response regulator
MPKATILLVEDEPSLLNGMHDLLQVVDIGYDLEILVADNGQAGLEAIEEQPPDLIVSDIMMPIMNGYELLQSVRRNPSWTHIPFIFLTAKGKREDIHKGRTSGANLYITKPFNSQEFVELIKVQLDRSLALQATHQQSMGLLKRNLLQILNHEFRTPLTYVTAYLDMIMVDTDHGIDNNFPEYLRGIQAGCVRLTQLVKDFIRVLELRSGETEQQLRREVTVLGNLPALLSTVVASRRPLADSYQITLHYEEPPALPAVVGVAEGLQDAFTRLLENGIKFTHMFKRKAAGNVYITTAVTDHEVHFIFDDEGMGFPAHATDRLFELFYQHNRGLLEQQGAGIGLTIAQGLVALHGGRIEVESVEKEGSTFTIILPIHRPNAPVRLPSTAGQQLATVLIVEDDHHLLVGLQELLQISISQYKLDVLTAENGLMGLEVLAERQPDLIISDIMMPEMSGYEFLAEVRKNPKWIQIPFIFLTAKGEHHEIHQGLRSGVEEYITKPYHSDHLLEMVVAQLDRHFQVQNAISQSFESLKRSILDLITPDLQQPLSSVSQFSSELETRIEKVNTDQELINSLEEIQVDSLMLTKLVEDLITLAELWTGEAVLSYEMRATPIATPFLLLHEVAQNYQLDPRQPVSVNVKEEDHNLPAIYGVSTLLTNCLQRLIDACLQRQTSPGVELSLDTENDMIHFRITGSLLLTADELTQLQALFAGQQMVEMNLMASTSLQIAYGNIGLHNGRISIEPLDSEVTVDGTDKLYRIVVALPIYDGDDSMNGVYHNE